VGFAVGVAVGVAVLVAVRVLRCCHSEQRQGWKTLSWPKSQESAHVAAVVEVVAAEVAAAQQVGQGSSVWAVLVLEGRQESVVAVADP
jgi:hypothetical protein